MLIFEGKQVNPFSNGEKLLKFCYKYFSQEKRINQDIFWQKPEGLVRGTQNLACRNFRSCFGKSLKTTIFSQQPFIVNLTFKIYKYFPNFFIIWISKSFWIQFLRAMFNWSSWFHAHPFGSLFELQLICWQFLLPLNTLFNSYPNINWKWNCSGVNSQIFWSEIILAWENGSQGHHFGKFLISKFLKGLMHSAMARSK